MTKKKASVQEAACCLLPAASGTGSVSKTRGTAQNLPQAANQTGGRFGMEKQARGPEVYQTLLG